jgi:hypothetical protein
LFTEVEIGKDPLFAALSDPDDEVIFEPIKDHIKEELLEETPTSSIFAKPIFEQTELTQRRPILEETRR